MLYATLVCSPARLITASSIFSKTFLFALAIGIVFLSSPSLLDAQTTRLVVLKIDGLPNDTVEKFVQERDPQTGKSQLPWIDHIFYQGGTRLANFYVRGVSLSGPSWSMLDTGQHLQIKGNVEFDRYTLHVYDYLNLIPFFLKGASGGQVDMVGVQVLDSLGIPLLLDAWPQPERYSGFSIYQRGPRYLTFSNALQNRFKRPPRELFDEWTMGLELRSLISDELIKELILKLQDPQIHYLDLVLQDFDHLAHSNADRASQLRVLKELDAVIGQVWTAIQNTPEAPETALVMVSDHGINSTEKIYSQGFNLVKLLGSAAGGGHHVTTKRRLLLDYAIKGLNPFYYFITTNTPDSYYLKGQSDEYPTALLDFDGNERAAIHLRDSDLNLLQLLLLRLREKYIAEPVRRALTQAFFDTLGRRRHEWASNAEVMKVELGALHRVIEKQSELWKARPRKFTAAELRLGRDDDLNRIGARLKQWQAQERDYNEYLRSVNSLLALKPVGFDPAKLRIGDVIPRQAMGENNTVYQLQNYVVGFTAKGPLLDERGELDLERSLLRVNYFSLLQNITVRNNVQREVSHRPVDFVATTVPVEALRGYFRDLDEAEKDAVWIYGGPNQQALIFARRDAAGQLSFLYHPVRELVQAADGSIHLEATSWQSGLPLKVFEDPDLAIPAGDKEQWLSQWHTDVEWLRALHHTRYSNGLVGVYEVLGHQQALNQIAETMSDEQLLRRLARRVRRLTDTDLVVVANDHWNFDARGFNPGGNHGSFLRVSTHSTWMLAGGSHTGIQRGAVIAEPYDSLSFVPTMLALTGKLGHDMSLSSEIKEKGFGPFPGRIVKELISR